MNRPNPHTLPPDFRSKEENLLLRRHRMTIMLNDMEMEAIKRYQENLGGKSRSAICRDAVMEVVLKGLEEFQPTLF